MATAKSKKKAVKATKKVTISDEKSGNVIELPEGIEFEIPEEEELKDEEAPIATPRILKKEWLIFIGEYIKNGNNGQEAYLKAYPKCVSKDAARTSAARLLQNVCVREEINHIYNSQTVTENYIISELQDLVRIHKDGKGGIVAMKSLECLAKVKGMLVDTKKIAFSGDNPAVFLPVCSPDEAKEMNAQIEGKRLVE